MESMGQSRSRCSASSLAALIRDRSVDRGDAEFLRGVDGPATSVTFTELAELAARRSAQLAATAPGARIALLIDDSVALASAFVTVIAAGRIAVPLDPRAPLSELLRIGARMGFDAVVTDRTDLTALGVPVLPVEADPAGRVQAGDTPAGGVLLSTSGSTGEPKSVLLSEAQLLYVAAGIATHNELGPADRGFNCLPLFHINAEVVGVLASLYAGATLVLARRFSRAGFWERLVDEEITWLNAVPAILAILSAGDVPQSLPTLRFIRSASAPLPTAVRERVSALGVPLVESYGMTEAASQITATPLHGEAPARSCGRPVGVDLEIRDAARRPVPTGVVGHVTVRGAGVISGYDGGREARRFDSAGWLDTNDMGYVDADGFVYLVGRKDDAINRGGELVYPREIEEVVQDDPGVREVVVTGREHDILGAVPVAFVIPTDPDESEEVLRQRLSERCATRLSPSKRPAAFDLVPDFPRAATGKVQRHRLAGLSA